MKKLFSFLCLLLLGTGMSYVFAWTATSLGNPNTPYSTHYIKVMKKTTPNHVSIEFWNTSDGDPFRIDDVDMSGNETDGLNGFFHYDASSDATTKNYVYNSDGTKCFTGSGFTGDISFAYLGTTYNGYPLYFVNAIAVSNYYTHNYVIYSGNYPVRYYDSNGNAITPTNLSSYNDKVNSSTPQIAAFKYGASGDVISSPVEQTYGDWWAQNDHFMKVEAYNTTRSTNSYVRLYFWTTDYTNTYDGVLGPAKHSYRVYSPIIKNLSSGAYWGLSEGFDVVNRAVCGYAISPSYGACEANSYYGNRNQYDGNVEEVSTFNHVVVEEGKGGKMYIRAYRSNGDFYVSIGEPKPNYIVNVSSNNALGIVNSEGGSYKEGTNSDTYTAENAAGGQFDGWYLDGTKVTGTTSEYTITNYGKSIQLLNLQAGHTLEAKFIAIGGSYAINYGVSPAGAGTFTQATYGGTPGTTFSSGTSISGGESVTLAVEATSGYRFDKWNDNVSTTSRTFTVSKEENLVAQFIKTYTISTACEDETGNATNKGSITGGGTKDDNTSCTLTASSTEPLNYYFKEWKDNNSTNASRTFTVNSTTSATTYTAVFAAREVVNITASSDMEMTKTGEYWSVSGEGTDASDSYTMNIRFDAASLTGNFNSGVNTSNTWVQKTGGSQITAQNISVATVTEPTTGRLHIVATIIGSDEKKYVITGDYDKPMVGSWGTFSWDDPNHVISTGTTTSTSELCSSQWTQTSRPFLWIEAFDNSKSTNNYVIIYIATTQSSQYKGYNDVDIVGPKKDITYTFTDQPLIQTQDRHCIYRMFSYEFSPYSCWEYQSETAIPYLYDNVETNLWDNGIFVLGRCNQSSVVGSKASNSNNIDVNTTNRKILEDYYVITTKGKDGKPFIRLYDNSDNLLIVIGAPAKPYTLAWDANGKSLTGGTAAGSVNEWTSITAPTSNTPGYTVSSWLPAFTGTMPSNDVTYVAQWSTIPYTITYNGLEDATNSNPISYNVETETFTLANPGKRDGFIFAGWKDKSDNTITQIAKGSTGDLTLTATWNVKSSNIELCEYCNDAHYNTFKDNYNNETVNVTYNRQFTASRWSTMCLPFSLDLATMIAHDMYGCVYEFKYATGNANVGSGVNLYFSNAKKIEAGKCYIVNANADLAAKESFVFSNVKIDVSKDLGEALNSKEAYDRLSNANGYKTKGDIKLVGTLRNGTLIGSSTEGNTYMGLKSNKIYYPNTTAPGSTIWAYRGIFHSSKTLDIKNKQKMRIIVDGEDRGELILDADGEILNAGGDAPSRKFIRDGVLYIEREGVVYDAQGKRVEN